MNSTTFIDDFLDILQRDEPVDPAMQLADIEEWDSLSMMATIAYFEKNFAIKLVFAQLKKLKTVQELIGLAQGAIQ